METRNRITKKYSIKAMSHEENKLANLRKLWLKTKNQNRRKIIEKAGKDIKAGIQFGSRERGGNGLCYDCNISVARPGCLNCQSCADRMYASTERKSIPQMQQSLLEMGKNAPKESDDERINREAQEIFFRGTRRKKSKKNSYPYYD